MILVRLMLMKIDQAVQNDPVIKEKTGLKPKEDLTPLLTLCNSLIMTSGCPGQQELSPRSGIFLVPGKSSMLKKIICIYRRRV